MVTLSEIEHQKWDVIVIGTGMGGGVLGYSLAKAGKRVLFCEAGKSYLSNPNALRGRHAESYFPEPDYPQAKYRDILSHAGRWPAEIEDVSLSSPKYFIPYIGFGTGGSSALYGMAMERFLPVDFHPRACFPGISESTIPGNWPITYDDLRPYYVEAEKLFKIRGTVDPLRTDRASDHLLSPPPLSPTSAELHNFMSQKGMHPYRLPLACEYAEGCIGSQGYLCDRECKNDSARICLVPALTHLGATLLEECDVQRLEANREEVTGVVCSVQGREVTLQGDVVVLAAGALETPRILLNSQSPVWPRGLANDSDLVGRNLMRHYIDLYALFPKNFHEFSGNTKEIAFNDYYAANGQKFGTVQSFGSMPPPYILAAGAEHDARNSSVPWVGSLLNLAKPLVTAFFSKLFSRCTVLATIMEDLPFRENRVMLSSNGRARLAIRYQIHGYEHARIRAFRDVMSNLLKPTRFMLIKQAENNERIAHACGTCRFGEDSKESVLDANNRTHGISNLYVVDSSFFPSSAGTNPALTIAANALRVADHLTGTKSLN